MSELYQPIRMPRAVVKNEVGSLDFRMMGEMLGQSENDVIQGLSDRRLIFKNPMTSEWEPADAVPFRRCAIKVERS